MGEELGTSGNRCQRFRLGWVTAGGSLMAGEKEVTLPRPLDLHRPWPCSSGPLRRREGASTLGAYTYNPYSLSMESSL